MGCNKIRHNMRSARKFDWLKKKKLQRDKLEQYSASRTIMCPLYPLYERGS